MEFVRSRRGAGFLIDLPFRIAGNAGRFMEEFSVNVDRIKMLLQAASQRRLLVVGDLMLDEFVWGRVSRISPEAPVPVVEVTHETLYPGGAANVARNLRPFCRVDVIGGVGEDVQAERLRGLLEEERIGLAELLSDAKWATIIKTRIIARQQQVVRVDREKKMTLKPEHLQDLQNRLERLLPEVDAVILEDYGKGFVTQAVADLVGTLAASHGKALTVDPNPKNPIVWSGAAAIKPNRHEAFLAAGIPDPGAEESPEEDVALAEVGEILKNKWQTELLLITLGEHGMMLFGPGDARYHCPTRAREVFDVSGAGDTAIALFTLALTAGASPVEAAEISNHASGIVVGKLGTATLTLEELLASFER